MITLSTYPAAEERQWRTQGWEWGFEGPPFIKAEFKDGEKKTITLDIYPDFDEDLFDDPQDLPTAWWKLMEEACDDCEEALGDPKDGEKWHFKDIDTPCRWRPESEWEALYEHARNNKLHWYSDDEDGGIMGLDAHIDHQR